MRVRLVILLGCLAAAIALAAAKGTFGFEPNRVTLHFFQRGFYYLRLGASEPLVSVALLLLSVYAFAPRGVRHSAARWMARPSIPLRRMALPLAALIPLGLGLWDAPWGVTCPSLAVWIPLALVLACAILPRPYRLRASRVLARIETCLLRLTLAQASCLLAAAAFAILLAIKVLLYGDIPLTGDGASNLFQARILASGHLKLPLPDPRFPEFFEGTGIIVDDGWYSMYPPVHPALHAIGLWLRAPWLVGPLSGAITAAIVFAVGAVWFGRVCGFVAALWLVASPHFLAMSPSEMSHTTSSLWLALALGALAWGEKGGGWRAGALGGLAVGLAIATRPLTGLAMGVPLAVAFAIRSLRRPGALAPIVSALCGVGFIAFLFMLYNAGTTGDPLTLGYNRFGPHHRLGFGGPMHHTPSRSLFQALSNLSEHGRWGPGAFPGVYYWLGLFFLVARRGWREWTLIAMWLLLPLSYFFYYYQDLALGPRFLFELGPPGALLAARGLQSLLARPLPMPTSHGRRLFAVAGAACALATVPVAEVGLGVISSSLARNRAFIEACRRLDNRPSAVVFLRSYHQGIVAEENLRHPDGPWLLKDQGEARDREFVAAHPEREFFISLGSDAIPLNDFLPTPLEQGQPDPPATVTGSPSKEEAQP